MRTRFSFGLALSALVVLAACAGASSSPVLGEPVPETESKVTTTTGAKVTATIAAVTLGDECDSGKTPMGAPSASDCAPVDGGSCGGGAFVCRGSNVQIAFTSAGNGAAATRILEVTLHDATSGSELDKLDASAPKRWNGTTYVTWDQSVPAGAEVKASYDLSSPSWAQIGSGNGWNTYSGKFKIRVKLRVDQTTVILESTTLSREPAVAT